MSVATHHYNPDWLSDDALVAGFIVRQAEFRFLRDELARAPLEGSVQHYLLIGLRGAGKTTLLKRLAVAIRRDADLSDHLIALSFPEELYQVKDLADFWWAACEALVDELDRLGRSAEADALMDRTDAGRAASRSGDQPANAGLTLLLDTCAQLQRRPVMLVDNLDMVFDRIDKQGRKRKDPHAAAYWELREALSTTRSPIVIGGSVRLSEPFTDYDKAFYDFFIPKRLGRLELAEVRQVLEHLADRQGSPEIKDRLKTRPSRIEALYDLTGGNPRAIGLIFTLLQQGPNSRAVDDFERLMDLTTPYYKARFEDLPEQAQVVMHALAVRRPGDGSGLRFGHTAAELGAHAGLPTNTVSAQLDVLEREGLLEKSAAHGRTQYRIAEQLFRLWLQMRGNRRVRQSALGLSEFLEAMYDEEELSAALQGASGSALAEARLAFAMADMPGSRPNRRSLEAWGADCATRYAAEAGAEMDEVLPSSDLSEDLATLRALRARLAKCNYHGLTPAEQDALVGALDLRLEAKRAAVDALCSPASAIAEAKRMRTYQLAERRKLLYFGLKNDDLPLLHSLRARGFFPLPYLHPGDITLAQRSSGLTNITDLAWRLAGTWNYVEFADAEAAEHWYSWGRLHATGASTDEWAQVAGAFRRAGQVELARRALDEAIRRGITARAEFERGFLLAASNKDSTGAEAAIQLAIQLNPTDARLWNGLGILLAKQFDRAEEAEAAFRKAISIDPNISWQWVCLGNLLADLPGRGNESEAAYRRAIEVEPSNVMAMNNLGAFLASQSKSTDESEAIYHRAIDLDPTQPFLWGNLGSLLSLKPSRIEEAKSAYQQALVLDTYYGRVYGNLGRLQAEQGNLDAAEAAFEKAITLETDIRGFWQSELDRTRTRRQTNAATHALAARNFADTRAALEALLAGAGDIPTVLVSTAFVEDFLAPLLANRTQAASVLGLLHGLGYERHARPLLLAFEAAVEDKPDLLDVLEPETRNAAKRMYERLTKAAQRKAQS